jgi:hypothetical protein
MSSHVDSEGGEHKALLDFGQVTKAVHDAWEFAWPPVVTCVAVYCCGRTVNPRGTDRILEESFDELTRLAVKVDSLRSLLDSYGLTKLIPIVSVIGVVLFLYLINSVILVAVSKLPPKLSFHPDRLLWRSLPLEEKQLLARRYPNARSFNFVYYSIMEEFPQKRKVNFHNIYHRIQDIAKLVFLASIIIYACSDSDGRLSGVAITSIVAIGTWLVSLLLLLSETEQSFFRSWSPVRIALRNEAADLKSGNLSESAPIAGTKMTEEQKSRAEAERLNYRNSARWWDVVILRSDYVGWLKRTFKPINNDF